MDDRKLRIAFAKVKKDILELKEEFRDSNVAPNVANTTNLRYDNFIRNVENELKALTLFTKELEDRIEHNKELMKGSKVSNVSSGKDLKDDFEQLEGRFADFSEIINEKIDIELNALRLEFTEEIAKVYDRVFTEILDLKGELDKNDKPTKKTSKKVVKKIPTKKVVENKEEPEEELYQSISESTENKRPGKLKKVMNWLFVDEEENMDDIKSQIKNTKDKDMEELY